LVAEFISKCDLNNDTSAPKIIEETSNNDSIPPKTPGLKVIDKIDLSKFEKPKKEIVKGKENIYIIDTNVFVDQPDIISKIDHKYSVVLSAKVIDELDYLKISFTERTKEEMFKRQSNISTKVLTNEISKWIQPTWLCYQTTLIKNHPTILFFQLL
jgi:hypothetical protein